jgi:peptidoglycan/xylan/chitin deacetylase (PgdA/CDA1 family)
LHEEQIKPTQKSLLEPTQYHLGQFGGFSFGGQSPNGVTVRAPLPAGTIFLNGAKTAILLTFDVEGTYGNGQGDMPLEVANYKRICEKLRAAAVPATFNVLGQMADEQGPEFVQWMFEANCEVATHGYWHELDKVFEKDKVYAGHYGFDVNMEQIKRGIDAINKIKPDSVKGIRLPYGYFNEFTYQAIEELNLQWTSNVGIDDFIVPGQGYGSSPFLFQLGEREFNIVEIPLDSQTYDWSIWAADKISNKTFVNAVNSYCQSKNLKCERTPKGAVKIWKQRIDDAISEQTIFTLLCHPINLTATNSSWSDPVEEFLFPVIEHLGELAKQNKIWACSCNALAEYYLQKN